MNSYDFIIEHLLRIPLESFDIPVDIDNEALHLSPQHRSRISGLGLLRPSHAHKRPMDQLSGGQKARVDMVSRVSMQ